MRPRARCLALLAGAALAAAAHAPPARADAGNGAVLYLPYAASRDDVAEPGRVWGLQLALEHYPAYHDATVAADLGAARAAGLGMVRTFVRWDEIEPANAAPEAFDWRSTDARLAPYREAGMDLVLAIVAYPDWAMVYQCGFGHRPGMAGEWRQFVRALAERYGDPSWRVALWEIGNEVDGRTEVRPSDHDPVRRPPGHAPGQPSVPIGGCWGDRAAEFVAFHRAAWRELRLVRPEARVAFGGLAYAPFEDNFVEGFLEGFLAAGGGPLVDVLSVHWFGGVEYAEPDGVARLRALRAVLLRHGVDVPIWLTEVHRMTRHGDRESELWPVPWLTHDLVEVLAEPYVQRVSWYGWRDFPSEVVAGVGSPWQRGMVREDGVAKRALPVLAGVVERTRGRPAPLDVRPGSRAEAEAAARAMAPNAPPAAFSAEPPEALFATVFARRRAGGVDVVAFARDGGRVRLYLALPPGHGAALWRAPIDAVREGRALEARPLPVVRGVAALDVDGDAAFVRLTRD